LRYVIKQRTKSNKAKSVDLKPDDYATMKKVVEILSSFEEATVILSSESYVTFSVVHPLLEHLVKVLAMS